MTASGAGMPGRVLRLIVMIALVNALFGGLRLTLSLQALAMGGSAGDAGLVTGLIMLIPAVSGHWMGRWSDARGGRHPCLVGMALLMAGAVTAGLATRLAGLCAASVLIGIGYMLTSISMNNAIGKLTDDLSRRRISGALALAFSLGAMLGPFVFGYVIGWTGHRNSFLLGAGLAVVFGAACVALGEVRDGALAGGAQGGAFGLLTDKALAPVFWANAVSSLSWDLFVFLFPIIGTAAGLGPSQVGLALSVFAAGGIAARLVLPLLPRRVGEWTLLRASFVVSALGYLAISGTADMRLLLPLAAITGLAAGFGLPVVLAILYATAPPHRRGEALGIRASITCAGQCAMPLAFGALGSVLGFGAVFGLAAAMLMGSAAIRSPRGG